MGWGREELQQGWAIYRVLCTQLRCCSVIDCLLLLPHLHAGANVVPAHLFESEVTPARLRRLVGDAKAVGMNLLRVSALNRLNGSLHSTDCLGHEHAAGEVACN